ncbi:hypothetical protein [Calothrix sp. 336/3]|uniref:hypothetical protein n=1 Tax=Calothrix sp. 336/3 TaxID=1337936 RepID=UPI0004E29189|nr:hypothetical protein [Calothrix sp. 336/3]AKG22335.1 hypothetical protein IJ00_14630 [Calothrix sp. 336/3]
MLLATELLIKIYSQNLTYGSQYEAKNAYIAAIEKFGCQVDADALLPVFLENPLERRELISPLMGWGNLQTGKVIYQQCFQGELLKPEMPEEILHCLGYLGNESITNCLFQYVQADNYYLSRAACLGLLNLSCAGLEDDIARAITTCYGKHLFPEFLPALAIKTGKLELLEQLYHLGETTASCDCNAGLILGVALYGEQGLKYFHDIIWNPRWETHGGGTGSDYWTYIAMQCLGMKLSDLYQDLKNKVENSPNLEHEFLVFIALLSWQIRSPQEKIKFLQPNRESHIELYQILFDWSTPHHDDSIIGIAHQVFAEVDHPIIKELYILQAQLNLAMQYEIEIETITHKLLTHN